MPARHDQHDDRALLIAGIGAGAPAHRLVEAAGDEAIAPGSLTLGTDNGSAYTARRFKAVLSGLGVAHRRGGYRDPESQAFIESWFAKLKSAASGATSSRPSIRPGR